VSIGKIYFVQHKKPAYVKNAVLSVENWRAERDKENGMVMEVDEGARSKPEPTHPTTQLSGLKRVREETKEETGLPTGEGPDLKRPKLEETAPPVQI
jgi:hypothetical protein